MWTSESKCVVCGTSLAVQWLTALQMQGVQVRSLVRELRSRVLPSEAKDNNNNNAFHVH